MSEKSNEKTYRRPGHIYLSSPTLNGLEMEYVKEAFDTNWVAPLGKNVDEFEREMAEYVGVAHAAALVSGTAAIHLALKAVGVKQGDVVFSSSFTFAATCNPILYESAVPVFIDSERDTWNMCPEALERAFLKYPEPKAVIVANLYGTPAKLDTIRRICDEHGTALIEDAAESIGATLNGRQTGSFGAYGALSFNGNKVITTSGGGMLLGDDGERMEKVRFWATQARDHAPWYEHSELGYNYRMSNIVAGIGRGQLRSLDDYVNRKRSVYDSYERAFKSNPYIRLNPFIKNSRPNHWLSCITLEPGAPVTPMDIIAALERADADARPIWKPMQLQPLYKNADFFASGDGYGSSVSEDIFARGVCLPSDIKMTGNDMDRVTGAINALFDREELI